MKKLATSRQAKACTPTGSALTVIPAGTLSVPANVSEDFAQIRELSRTAADAGVVMGFSSILIGVDLLRLHKKYGVRRGRPSKQFPSQLSISWEELVKHETGYSDEWARRLMAMGEEARKRVKTLNTEQVRTTPFGDLPAAVRNCVIAEVRKLMEGDTLAGLAREWGVAKALPKPRGGGDGRPKGSKDTRTEEEKAQELLWPVQDALGTTAEAEKFEAMILLLPEKDKGGEEASLDGLKDKLQVWLKTVDDALKHRAAERRAKRS